MDKIDVDAVRLRARVIATSSTLADSILRECVRAIDQLTAERDEAQKERDKARAAVLDPIIASHAQIRETAQASDYISEPEADELAWTNGEYSALQAKLDAMQAAVVESCHRADSWIHARPSKATTLNDVLEPLREYLPKPEPDPLVEEIKALADKHGTLLTEQQVDVIARAFAGDVVMKGEG